MASLEAEASALSSVASSQDSLHKQPKKKGIKSSIGRLFGKKEKGRLAHLAHRQVMVDPQGEILSGLKQNDMMRCMCTEQPQHTSFFSFHSDDDGPRHGGPGHGGGQVGNSGREGPQIEKEVSLDPRATSSPPRHKAASTFKRAHITVNHPA